MLRFVVFIALFAVVVYAGFWLLDRRKGGGGKKGAKPIPRGPVGPDDDEDFLRELERRRRHSKDGEPKNGKPKDVQPKNVPAQERASRRTPGRRTHQGPAAQGLAGQGPPAQASAQGRASPTTARPEAHSSVRTTAVGSGAA